MHKMMQRLKGILEMGMVVLKATRVVLKSTRIMVTEMAMVILAMVREYKEMKSHLLLEQITLMIMTTMITVCTFVLYPL